MFQEKRSMFADRNRVVFKAIIVAVIAIIMIGLITSASAEKYTPKGPLPVPRIPQNRPKPGGGVEGDCNLNSLASIQAYMLGSHSFTPTKRENKGILLSRTYSGPGDYTYNKDPVWWNLYAAFGYDNAPEYDSDLYPAPMTFYYEVSVNKLLEIAYSQLSRGVPVHVYREGPHASVIIGYRGTSDKLTARDFTVMEIKPWGTKGWQNSSALFTKYAANPSTVYNSNQESCYVTLDAWLQGRKIKVVSHPTGSPAKKLSLITQGEGIIQGAENGSFIRKGTSVSLTAGPDTGFNFAKWKITGVPGLTESTSQTLTFTMPDNEVTAEATFVRNLLVDVRKWTNIKVDSTTQTSAKVSGQFYFSNGVLTNLLTGNSKPTFYLLWAKDQSSVISATPDNSGNAFIVSLGQLVCVNPSETEYNYSVSATVGPVPLVGTSMLKQGETFYFKFVAKIGNNNYSSPVASGKTKGQLTTWTNLHTEDSKYGLFNAQVNWDKSVSMKEVGCFVSTNKTSVSNATKNSYDGCAMKKDTSIDIMNSLTTNTSYGTIVFYKGPSFGTISSFKSGTTYYYKFYSYTSDGEVVYSAIASYTPNGTSVQGLTSVWMTPVENKTVEEGTTVNFQFGADQPCTFYLHVYDRNSGVDYPYKQSSNVTSGSYSHKFNTPGSYHVYVGAAHSLGDKANNGIIVTVTAKDSSVPVITSAQVTNVNSNGYDVSVEAADDTGIAKIRIGTWHSGMSIDDAKWQEVSATDSASFHIDISEFGNARNVTYYTNALAYDAAGNISTAVRCANVEIESQAPVINAAVIDRVSSEGYYVYIDASDNSAVRAVHIDVTNDKGTSASWSVFYGGYDAGDEYKNVTDSFYVDISDNSLEGMTETTYHTTIYTEDLCGNASSVYTLEDVYVGNINLYDLRDEELTFCLPDALEIVEDGAFEYVSARYFIVPVTVESIGSEAFPSGSTVFIYANTGIDVEPDAIIGSGTFVEMSDVFSTEFAEKMENSGSNYVLLNGTQPRQWTDSKKKTVYRYRTRETTSSNQSSLSGWILYDQQPGTWGKWISSGTTPVTASTDVEVNPIYHEAQTGVVGYKYRHYRYTDSNGKVNFSYGSNYANGQGFSGYWEYKNTTERLPNYKVYEGVQSYGYQYDFWFFEEEQTGVITPAYTEYQYRTRPRTYYFYQWTDWSDWQEEPITENENIEVEIREI